MKKAAVKGLIILVGVVLVCVFFSGTLHSITTAKVQMTKAKTGKLTSEISMTGSLFWPAAESIFVPGMTGEDTLILRRLRISTGSWVKAGQIIAECEVSDADSRLSALQDSYDAKENEYLELERKNRLLQLTPQQKDWYEAYQALKSARQAEQAATQELKLTAWKAGVSLKDDGTLPSDTTDDATLQAWKALDQCRKNTETAQSVFSKYNLLTINEEVIAYLEKKAELEGGMKELTNQMTQLCILKETAAEITAPHDGYIVSLELKEGDFLTQNTVLAQITEEGVSPVIRLDPGNNRKSIPAGTDTELTAGSKTVKATVREVTISGEGKPCVDVQITRQDIAELGGITVLSESGAVSASIQWQAETSTTLIPTSALRGSEDNYYVYVIQADDADSGTGSQKTRFSKISRKPVTVLGQSGSVTSVSESLKHDTLVYMEDRPLSEGCEVMPYDEK